MVAPFDVTALLADVVAANVLLRVALVLDEAGAENAPGTDALGVHGVVVPYRTGENPSSQNEGFSPVR